MIESFFRSQTSHTAKVFQFIPNILTKFQPVRNIHHFVQGLCILGIHLADVRIAKIGREPGKKGGDREKATPLSGWG